MRKQILLIALFLAGITLKSSGQKLEKNQTDDFTKKTVKITSWESITATFASANIHVRVSLNGDLETFDVKIMLDKHFIIDTNQELMLKLDNDDVVTLQNTQYTTTCIGCGAVGLKGSEAPGIQVFYPVSKEQAEKLKAHKVTKIRVSTTDGYFDQDIKDKNSDKIKTLFSLV